MKQPSLIHLENIDILRVLDVEIDVQVINTPSDLDAHSEGTCQSRHLNQGVARRAGRFQGQLDG